MVPLGSKNGKPWKQGRKWTGKRFQERKKIFSHKRILTLKAVSILGPCVLRPSNNRVILCKMYKIQVSERLDFSLWSHQL